MRSAPRCTPSTVIVFPVWSFLVLKLGVPQFEVPILTCCLCCRDKTASERGGTTQTPSLICRFDMMWLSL
jgi:hypothetical protein